MTRLIVMVFVLSALLAAAFVVWPAIKGSSHTPSVSRVSAPLTQPGGDPCRPGLRFC